MRHRDQHGRDGWTVHLVVSELSDLATVCRLPSTVRSLRVKAERADRCPANPDSACRSVDRSDGRCGVHHRAGRWCRNLGPVWPSPVLGVPAGVGTGVRRRAQRRNRFRPALIHSCRDPSTPGTAQSLGECWRCLRWDSGWNTPRPRCGVRLRHLPERARVRCVRDPPGRVSQCNRQPTHRLGCLVPRASPMNGEGPC